MNFTKLPNNPLAPWSLINFDFLLSHTAYKITTLPFFMITSFIFLLYTVFPTLQTIW